MKNIIEPIVLIKSLRTGPCLTHFPSLKAQDSTRLWQILNNYYYIVEIVMVGEIGVEQKLNLMCVGSALVIKCVPGFFHDLRGKTSMESEGQHRSLHRKYRLRR